MLSTPVSPLNRLSSGWWLEAAARAGGRVCPGPALLVAVRRALSTPSRSAGSGPPPSRIRVPPAPPHPAQPQPGVSSRPQTPGRRRPRSEAAGRPREAGQRGVGGVSPASLRPGCAGSWGSRKHLMDKRHPPSLSSGSSLIATQSPPTQERGSGPNPSHLCRNPHLPRPAPGCPVVQVGDPCPPVCPP